MALLTVVAALLSKAPGLILLHTWNFHPLNSQAPSPLLQPREPSIPLSASVGLTISEPPGRCKRAHLSSVSGISFSRKFSGSSMTSLLAGCLPLLGLHHTHSPPSLHPVFCLLLLFSHSSCPTLYDPTDYSTPGFPVLHCLLEFSQAHVH